MTIKVHISVDMEGIAGVADGQDIRPGEAEYERGRRLMTDEANAAVRGVLAADPTAEVLVSDAHAQFRNLLPDLLHPHARLVRGRPRPYGMMSGLSDETDLVLCVGYHGRAGRARSVLAHTVDGGVIAEVRCDGRPIGEIGLNAALAAEHSAVPVLISGDDSVGAEAADAAPGMHVVEVKRWYGAGATDSLHPEHACARIEAAVPAAMAAADRITARRYDGPVDLEIDVLHPYQTENPLLVPGMRRLGGRTIGYRAADFPTAYGVVSLVALLGRP